MTAFIWLHENRCRIIVISGRNAIDTNDEWNNRASAESWVLSSYPEARIKYMRDKQEVKWLNQEWNACTKG